VRVHANGAVIVDTAPAKGRVLIVVLVKSVHLVLSLVKVVEENPDQATSNERSNGQTAEHPHDRGVVQERVESLGDGRSERVGEEVHGLDEGLHAGRRLGVGVLETSDGGENLGDTDQHVSTSLGSDVDVVALSNTVNLASRAERVTVARTGLVDVVLNNGSVDHGHRRDPETGNDTVDGRERDLVLAEEGEEELIHKRQENDNGDGIKVLHQIVGNAVTSHLTSLGDEVVREVAVHDPVDGVEAEHLASNKSALDLVDEVVVPGTGGCLAKSSLVGRLRGVHLAALDHLTDDTESVGNNGALRRTNDVNLAAKDEDECTDEEHAQTEQVSRPEVSVALHVRGRKARQGTDVDAPVEDHVDAGNGDRRVDDDALAGLLVGADDHLATLVLIRNQRSDVGLDTTSSETNNNDSSDEASKTSASLESDRDGGQGKDEETDDVNTTEDDDGVVLSEVLISDDSTENGRDVAPELEEGGETGSSLVSHAESTTTLAAIERTLNVVLEDTRGTVVGETLAKFDESNQEGGLGQRLADLAQSAELFLGGLYTTEAVVDVDVADRGRRAGRQRLLCLDKVLLSDAGSSDIVVVEGQAVQVGVLVSLSLLALQLVGSATMLECDSAIINDSNIRCFLCGGHAGLVHRLLFNHRSN
jgi:hypothetical protein